MCGREINKLATDLVSKILTSRGQMKIKSRHELLREGHNNIMVFNKSSPETVSFYLLAFLYVSVKLVSGRKLRKLGGH